MQISAGLRRLLPGSLKVGGTWQREHLPLPSKIALPFARERGRSCPWAAPEAGRPNW